MLTPDPLVSIIIPVYNAEKYLAETIASALEQSWPNTELIIIDDGSTDQSLLIAKNMRKMALKFLVSKIKVQVQPEIWVCITQKANTSNFWMPTTYLARIK